MTVKCASCGSELPENVKFCVMCGLPVSPTEPPAKSYATNITPIGTELLVAPDTARVDGKTEALAPDTNELPAKPGSTAKIAEPATDPLKHQTKETTIPASTDPLKHKTKETSLPTAAMKQKAFDQAMLLAS